MQSPQETLQMQGIEKTLVYYYSVADMCSRLEQEGKIEIYHVPQPGSDRQTAAIRISHPES
jgi:hypothetical protein